MKLEDFQEMIEEEFLDIKNKEILFNRIFVKIGKWKKFPLEYIEYFFETISKPMPLHAAAAIIYFRKNRLFSEKLTEFEQNLYSLCEQNFIREISSDSPNLKYCANLHTALSVLGSEQLNEKITQAVETISEQWKKVLFEQISICIKAVNGLETEEQSLLAPILKSFYINYSNEINCDFLLKELEKALTTNKAAKKAEITLSEILKSAVERKYFNYFKILYSMFPNWRKFQNEIKWEEFMELAFECADSPEHLIDLLYVCLEILRGNKTEIIEKWYRKIISFNPEKAVEEVVSFIYYSKCIDTGEPKDYVTAMQYYEENSLFSEILPSHSFPIGGIFVKNNTETILKDNPILLKEYLEKIGKNNIYHFDTELDCPEAPDSNIDCAKAIDLLCMSCDPETVIYCYFNTHIRKIYDIESFYRQILNYFGFGSFYSCNYTNDYIFKGTLMQKDNFWCHYVFETSQFLYKSEKFYLYLGGYGKPKHIFGNNSEKEVYLKLYFNIHSSMFTNFSAEILNTIFAEDVFSSIMNEIIETRRLSEEQEKKLEQFLCMKLLSPNTVESFVNALEILSGNAKQQEFLFTKYCNFKKSKFEYNRNIIKKLLLMAIKLKINSSSLLSMPIKPECLADIKDLAENCSLKRFNKVKGTLHSIEKEYILQFVPKNIVCEKAPIILNLKDVFVLADTGEKIGNGTICTADIEYEAERFKVTCIFTEKLTNKHRKSEHEFHFLTQQFCTDTEENLLEELRKKAEELKSYSMFFVERELNIGQPLILKTIENLLNANKETLISQYLEIIRHFRDDCGCYSAFQQEQFKDATINKEEKERLICVYTNLTENLIKKCTLETIAEIYEETILKNFVNFEKWCELADKYNKSNKFSEYIEGRKKSWSDLAYSNWS